MFTQLFKTMSFKFLDIDWLYLTFVGRLHKVKLKPVLFFFTLRKCLVEGLHMAIFLSSVSEMKENP